MKQIILNILLSILAITWRFQISDKLPKEKGLIGFWHGDMLPIWYKFRKFNPIAIVSQSKDGSLLANLLKYWGYKVHRGSSSKGGKEVLDLMTESAKNNLVLITPDGPRGPRNEMKAGIVVASQRSNSPIYFINLEIDRFKSLDKSWDKFKIPYPFAKIKLKISKPINISENLSRDEISLKIVELNKEFNN